VEEGNTKYPFRLESVRILAVNLRITVDIRQHGNYGLSLLKRIFTVANSARAFIQMGVQSSSERWGGGVQSQTFAENRCDVLQLWQVIDSDRAFPTDLVDFLLCRPVGGAVLEEVAEGEG